MDVILKGICRKLRHVPANNPTAKKMFCNTCGSYVLETDDRICICCGEKAKKKKSYYFTRWLLENITVRYQTILSNFAAEPTREPVTLYAKHKYVTYKVPLACAALYYETGKKQALPDWAEEVFKPRELAELKKVGTIAFIDRKMQGVGIF